MNELAKKMIRESNEALARIQQKMCADNIERMNTFLWLIDETVERERPEFITVRRPMPFSRETE